MKLLISLFLLFLNPATALSEIATNCQVKLYPRILFLNNDDIPDDIVIYESSCAKTNTFKLLSALRGLSGKVPVHFINEKLRLLNPTQKIDILPKSIHLLSVHDLLRSQLTLEKSYRISKFKMTGSKVAIPLEKDDTVNVSCVNCNSTGEKNIKVNVYNPFTSKNELYWGNSSVNKRIKVAKLKSSHKAYLSGVEQKIEHTYIETKSPENFFKDFDNIKFYKLNRSLDEGAVIKAHDVSSLKLVRPGTTVKILMQHRNLKLEHKAVARQSGIFDQTIELYSPSSKKRIFGRVVDFNTVEVKL